MRNRSEDIDATLMESLPGVKKLNNDKVDVYTQKPKKGLKLKKPVNHEQQDQAVHHTSRSIPGNTPESWFHHGLQKKLQRKIRMGHLTIDARLDLHGYRQHEATTELELFIHNALQQQARFLLIIHGKGYRSQAASILRPLVQHWLGGQEVVLAYCPAQLKDGGSGASYVYLKTLIR